MGGKLLKGIESMCVNSESEAFRISNIVRQGCIMSTWLSSGCSDEIIENGVGEEGSEISREGEIVENA